MGKDHSIFSVVEGKVVFKKGRLDRTFVSVNPN
jgi:large subunit ribosomal protein L27